MMAGHASSQSEFHVPEAGIDPRRDLAAFRRCLGQYGTGVTVVTARWRGENFGMTANSFSSVSLDPPLVLWSVKQASQSFPAFAAADHFAVNVLASDQIALAKHFGRSGDNKFHGLRWSPGLGGAPLLEGAIASFECRRAADHPGGDHLIVVGEVERFTQQAGEALLFVQGRFGVAGDYPGDPAVPAPGGAPGAGPMNEFITALMYRAHGVLSSALDEGREAEGFTVLQSRLMAAIETLPGKTLEELIPELFLGVNAAQDTLSELVAMRLVKVGAGGELRLTPLGLERNGALLARARAIEKRMLSDMAPGEVAACRKVLERLVERRG